MARSTKRNELTFLISVRVPSVSAPAGARTRWRRSGTTPPACSRRRCRASAPGCGSSSCRRAASAARWRVGSVTISRSGVPARLRSMPVPPPNPSCTERPASLLEMGADEVDLPGSGVRERDDDHSALRDRVLVLADLITLGEVRIEVVLAREDAARRDARPPPRARSGPPSAPPPGGDREHAGKAEVHRARPGCWAAAP